MILHFLEGIQPARQPTMIEVIDQSSPSGPPIGTKLPAVLDREFGDALVEWSGRLDLLYRSEFVVLPPPAPPAD
jgi:hypothetical protein